MKAKLQICNFIADAITYALISEAIVWPSPGLVSLLDSGIHKDMDIYLFTRSSITLQKYFVRVCKSVYKSYEQYSYVEIFQQIRKIGLEAEEEMFSITNNVNTHKGAIFHMTLISAAATIVYIKTKGFCPEDICMTVTELSGESLLKDFSLNPRDMDNLTIGLKAYREYGLMGIRGEAISGYEMVLKYSLPALKELLEERNTMLREALSHTLILIISKTFDTTLLNRKFDIQRIKLAQDLAQKALDAGGILTDTGRLLIDEMTEVFIRESMSPGGSADLLAVTYALFLLEGCKDKASKGAKHD